IMKKSRELEKKLEEKNNEIDKKLEDFNERILKVSEWLQSVERLKEGTEERLQMNEKLIAEVKNSVKRLDKICKTNSDEIAQINDDLSRHSLLQGESSSAISEVLQFKKRAEGELASTIFQSNDSAKKL